MDVPFAATVEQQGAGTKEFPYQDSLATDGELGVSRGVLSRFLETCTVNASLLMRQLRCCS